MFFLTYQTQGIQPLLRNEKVGCSQSYPCSLHVKDTKLNYITPATSYAHKVAKETQ